MRHYLYIIGVLLATQFSFAQQTQEELEQKKIKLQQEIREKEQKLQEVRKKEKSVAKLLTIQKEK